MKIFLITIITTLFLIFLVLLGEAYVRGEDLTDPGNYVPPEIRSRMNGSNDTR